MSYIKIWPDNSGYTRTPGGTYDWDDESDMFYTATDMKRLGVLRWNKKNYGITSNYTKGDTQYITKMTAHLGNEANVEHGEFRCAISEESTFGRRQNDSNSSPGYFGKSGDYNSGNITPTGSTSNDSHSVFNFTSIAQNGTNLDFRKTSGNDYMYILVGKSSSSSTQRRFRQYNESPKSYVEIWYVQQPAIPAIAHTNSGTKTTVNLSIGTAATGGTFKKFRYRYSTNGGSTYNSWTSTTENKTTASFTYTNSGTANVTFYVQAQCYTNNNDDTSNSVWGPTTTSHWTVPCNVKPATPTIQWPAAGGSSKITYNSKPYFKMTATDSNDDAMTYQYKIDSGSWTNVATNVASGTAKEWQPSSAVSAGSHTLYVRASDGSLTSSEASRTFTYTALSTITSQTPKITRTNMENLKTYITNLAAYYGVSATPTSVTIANKTLASEWNGYSSMCNNCSPHISGTATAAKATKITASGFYNNIIGKLQSG